MGRVWIDMGGPIRPKRGDLVQSNIGNRRERTWFILRSIPARKPRRFKLWIERWWQIEASLRWRLYLSAERAGGQRVITMYPYPPKPRKHHRVDLFA